MIRFTSADEAVAHLKPGQTVFVAGGTAEPGEILAALGRNPQRAAGVNFVSVPIPGFNRLDFCDLHPEARATVFFATADNRDSIANGRARFIPMQYSGIFDYLQNEMQVDVVMAQLPPAADNVQSIGLTADFLPAVLEKTELLMAEVNQQQPIPIDSPSLNPDGIDVAVACDRPVPALPVQKPDEVAATIARHVAALIQDGDCLQIGIGAIPAAVLGALTEKNDLGVHSGMITDGVMVLAKLGIVTGLRKTLDRNRIVTGTALGSRALVEWAGSEPDIIFRPVSHTHDVGLLRRIDNFVSLNSALEVDLFGQVNSDMMKGYQWAGTGGSVDMMRGAAMSRGGRSIVALKSLSGSRSRIVPALKPHTPATALRTDMDYVVTEHGARRIRHLPTAARAEALIELAAPQHRDELRAEWLELIPRI